jgi:hypothetical protein
MGNAIDEQNGNVTLVVVTAAAVVIVVREEGSNSDAGARSCLGGYSAKRVSERDKIADKYA